MAERKSKVTYGKSKYQQDLAAQNTPEKIAERKAKRDANEARLLQQQKDSKSYKSGGGDKNNVDYVRKAQPPVKRSKKKKKSAEELAQGIKDNNGRLPTKGTSIFDF